MTRSDFPGPGLTEEQWDRLKQLATSLTAEQSNWVGGYFTGYADAARSGTLAPVVQPAVVDAANVGASQRRLTILFGSETGNGLAMGEELAQQAVTLGLAANITDMADYRPASLKQEQDLLIITSTHGEGEPPQPALGFFEFLYGRKAPRLEGARFAVMALGDSTYEFYCEAGKRLDLRLAELGAERLAPRLDCDVDQLAMGKNWALKLLEELAESDSKSAPATVAAPPVGVGVSQSYSQSNPFAAELLENIVITGRGSSKETRHLELSLADSGIAYEPGDALGIVGRNDPAVAAQLLECLGFTGDEPLLVDERTTTLSAALEADFEIATATPRFIGHWAEISGSDELAALAGPDRAAQRTAYLEAHHVIDIVRRFGVRDIAAESFVAGLRGLQPRLYSIASSHAAQDGDVHLTVSTVHYALHGSERWGVVSGGLRVLPDDATLPVYLKRNPHFRLPADDVPIVMIGAGTGVAPYRAFTQERQLRGAKGHSWLFFGERNFRSDFLYQAEWQGHLMDGSLTFMDVAFSRDGPAKTYVQQRLRERSYELFAWLQEGAHLYVCGDAEGMARGVHRALLDVVAEAGGYSPEAAEDYVRTLQRDGRYQRDVY